MENDPRPDGRTLLRMYELCARIMQNDARIQQVMRTGRLTMPYYSPRGQEIIPAALSVNLKSTDYMCTIYRGLHDMIAKGMPLTLLWAELAGRATGSCKGKGGPMHITHPESGVMVTTGVVGSTMPIANGLAWASQMRTDGRVTIANFGDGAANIGAFHESLNLAGLWKLPVIFVCQNNLYAEHTSFRNSTAVAQIGARGAGYGMPGITVNGNDPDAMYGVARIAVERARAGEGPTLIEAMTYRFNGHLVGDNGHYMDPAERKAATEADPVKALRARIIAEEIADEAHLAAMERSIGLEIDSAVETALADPYPGLIELNRDVFAVELV